MTIFSTARLLLWVGGIAAMGAGCAGKGDKPLTSEVFYAPQGNGASKGGVVGGAVDEPGAVAEPGGPQVDQKATGVKPEEPIEEISPIITESVKPPSESAPKGDASVASTRPTTGPATNGGGQYMTIGGVVAEVNGRAIYAHKIADYLDKDLRAKALEFEPKKFTEYAAVELYKARAVYIRNELEYDAAYKNLSEQDRLQASKLTTIWRQQRITEAGGSVEMARRKAAAEGNNFEEMAFDIYRTRMSQLYYQRKVYPRIQVTAQDMREFYQRNIAYFTVADKVRFRLVEIDPKAIGGANAKEAAIQRAQEVKDKAEKENFSFEEMAASTQYNHSAYLRGTRGDVGWINKGDYRSEVIEKAVWALQPGQLTDVISENGKFYVAKLEERQQGKVSPFEEEQVQDKIRDTLFRQQFSVLHQQHIRSLIEAAILNPPRAFEDEPHMDEMLMTAMEIVMQRYPSWVAK